MTHAVERQGAFVMEEGAGRRIHVTGSEITVKISSADTGGAFTVFEGATPPESGPPMHRHREQDEWWYVLDGEFRFMVDGEEIYARTGDTVFAPRGSVHTFQNVGERVGRTVTTAVPGGLDEFFAELEVVVPRGARPDPARMIPVFEKYELELLGPPLAASREASPAD